MLVDVVRLRTRGVLLPREEVLALAPRRGHLSIVRLAASFPRQAFLTHRAEQTTASNATCIVPPFPDVVLTRMAGESFVIAGIERFEQFATLLEFQQSWWCRLVHPCVDGRDSDHR